MTANRASELTTRGVRLHLAFELGWNAWQLAFTIGHGQPARLRSVAARDPPIPVARMRLGQRPQPSDQPPLVVCRPTLVALTRPRLFQHRTHPTL